MKTLSTKPASYTGPIFLWALLCTSPVGCAQGAGEGPDQGDAPDLTSTVNTGHGSVPTPETPAAPGGDVVQADAGPAEQKTDAGANHEEPPRPTDGGSSPPPTTGPRFLGSDEMRLVTLEETLDFEVVDLDDYLEGLPEDMSGAILRVALVDGPWQWPFEIRRGGSVRGDPYAGESYLSNIDPHTQASVYVGVDAEHRIEIWRQSGLIEVYFVGYFREEARFYDEYHEWVITEESTWTVLDASAHVSDAAVFGIFSVYNDASPTHLSRDGWNFRYAGAPDDRLSASSNGRSYAIVPLDERRRFEFITEDLDVRPLLVGEITKGQVRTSSPENVAPSAAGTYEIIDLSAMAPPNAVMALVETYSEPFLPVDWAARPAGDEYYPIRAFQNRNHSGIHALPIDDRGQMEVLIGGPELEMHVWGFLTH